LRSAFFGFKLHEEFSPLPSKRTITGKLKSLESESLQQSLPMRIFRTVVARGFGQLLWPRSPIVSHDEPFLFDGGSLRSVVSHCNKDQAMPMPDGCAWEIRA